MIVKEIVVEMLAAIHLVLFLQSRKSWIMLKLKSLRDFPKTH